MKEGQLFQSTNKLNDVYLYKYLGTDTEITGCSYIHLFNITTDTNTDVEQEWFNQRKIVLQ